MEAKDWLNKLKKILDLLQSEDSDRIMFVKFLLEEVTMEGGKKKTRERKIQLEKFSENVPKALLSTKCL